MVTSMWYGRANEIERAERSERMYDSLERREAAEGGRIPKPRPTDQTEQRKALAEVLGVVRSAVEERYDIGGESGGA